MGGGTGTTSAPTAGQQQGVGRGGTGWSALTEAMKMFGPAATMKEFSKKLIKWQEYFRGESKKCTTFKIQAVEAANLRVFVGTVKGDRELKIFHSTLKYNNFFVTQNISVNFIAFMGDHPPEERP